MVLQPVVLLVSSTFDVFEDPPRYDTYYNLQKILGCYTTFFGPEFNVFFPCHFKIQYYRKPIKLQLRRTIIQGPIMTDNTNILYVVQS